MGEVRLQLKTLEARTRVIHRIYHASFFACFMAIAFAVAATAFPQGRALDRLELKLKAAQKIEQTVLADREYKQIEMRALKEDPAFLEIHARDRLGYYMEGERVFKFKRTE